MQFHRSLLAIAVMAASTAVSAEEPSDNTYHAMTQLDQVTVTATRTERKLDDVASSVAVKDADEMEKEMVRDIRDLVRYEPGVNVTSDGRTGSGSFNIRGMDANRVKITVDGVDQAKSFDSTKMFLRSQRNYVDMDSMKAVEIVKGPASTMHGSDAIGGIVAFITKDPADFLEAEGDDSYASFKAGYASSDSSWSETVTMANRTSKLESMLIYTRRDGDEMETYGGANINGDARGEADPQDHSSDNILAKFQYQLNDDNRIGLTAEWQGTDTETDMRSMVGRETTGNGQPYTRFDADDSTSRKRVGIFHEWDAFNTAFDTLEWKLNWQESETNQVTRDEMLVDIGGVREGLQNQERLKDYIYKETSWQLDANLTKELLLENSEHLFSYGFSYKNTEQENLNKTYYIQNPANKTTPDTDRYAPVATVETLSFYLQDEISLLNDRLTVTPGVRYDHFSPDTDIDSYYCPTNDCQINDKSYDNWSARLGTVYKFTDALSGFFQYSQGFGTPDLFAMYFEENRPSGAPVHVMPNPELKPEKSESFELGLRANGQMGSAEITAFYNKYEDFIEQILTGTRQEGLVPVMEFQYQNLDEATIKGIEFRSQLWLDEAIGLPMGTSFNTAISWADGEGSNAGAKDEPLNSISPLTAVLGLGYDAPSENWGGNLTWTLVAEKDEDDISQGDQAANETTPDGSQFATHGYGLVDVTAYYKPAEDITINAGIFNITDKQYWVWDDVRGLSDTYQGLDRYTQPGRNFSVSVKWEI